MAARRLCALLALLACAGRGSGLGDHALFEAAKKGDVGATRTALDRATAHAASKPEDVLQTLQWSDAAGRMVEARVVVKTDPTLELKDKNGWTPLTWASSAGHLEVVRMLLEKGADKEAKDSHGNTPLIWASYNGNAEAVRMLLDKGADVAATNNSGNTALKYALEKGHSEIVKLLQAREGHRG